MIQIARTTLPGPGSPVGWPARHRVTIAVTFGLMLILFAGQVGFAATQGSARTDLNPERIALTGPTRLQARNITIQVTEDVQIEVKSVDALLLGTRAGTPISLDDPRSMKVQIQNAETSISAAGLTRLLNEYVLPHAETPVRDLEVSFEGGQVHVAGKLHKMVDIPFSAEGPISVTPPGDVRVHFVKITAAGFMHKKLLDWLGLNASSVADPGRQHSFRVEDDDVIFPLHVLFPPPHFTGRLQSAAIVGDELVQVFGTVHSFAPAPIPAEHYLYFRGGLLKFGRLTMQGVDLELLNKDEGQPLNFSIDHLYAEAMAGYFKNLPNRGVVAYIGSYKAGK